MVRACSLKFKWLRVVFGNGKSDITNHWLCEISVRLSCKITSDGI